MSNDAPERLYGTPGAESYYRTVAGCYEADIEPWLDEKSRELWPERKIEEWSVRAPATHLPGPEWLLEWMLEHAADAELDEYGFDAFKNACDDEVVAAAEALRTLWASKVSYRMCDEELRVLTVTWDEQGRPLVDGEPLGWAEEYERCAEVSPTTGERCVRKTPHDADTAAGREHRAETPGYDGYTYWQDGTGVHGYSHHVGWRDWSVRL